MGHKTTNYAMREERADKPETDKKASGPSLLEKLAQLERKEKDGSPRSKPALQKPSPQPGTTIVKKAAPSLFIERKKPREPVQKPTQTQDARGEGPMKRR
ncbi:hypothetical protein MMYC01_202871 [Madurella mycetomatis]|uniref:Uncharacterized protein n=1 Tax=Madurella mycetomatis TaxID=100816 RepID=A0A175W919_9PEZI|nr:hypothetical protein MMYC01_202871 [Madurella mycetomatis]